MARERGGFRSRGTHSKLGDNTRIYFGDSASADDPGQGDAFEYWDGAAMRHRQVAGGAWKFGDSTDTSANEVHVFDGGSGGKAGKIVLYDSGGQAWYLWPNTDGDVFIASADPANDTAGTIVGTQS